MTNIQQSSGSAFNESVALNAYAIVNATSIEWDVKVYRFKRADGQPMAHGDRGGIKNAVWTLKKFPESRCSGYYGYIIDISQDEIAVPSRWELACGKVADGAASVGILVRVWDLLREAGVPEVNIATNE